MRRHRWADLAWVSDSFCDQYRSDLTPQLRRAVVSKFVQMCRLFDTAPRLLGERYDRISYLRGEVFELDVTDAWRGVVRVRDGTLALYRVGDHNMILRQRYTAGDLASDDQQLPLPLTQFVCESVLSDATAKDALPLLDALDERWLFATSGQQRKAIDELVAPFFDENARPIRAVINGGPGTGKTVLLTTIADFKDWDPSNVALDISDRVAEYLAAGIGERVLQCRRSADKVSRQEVLLVDDPRRWRDIETAFGVGAFKQMRLVAVATDLAQVENVVSDRELRVFLGGRAIRHIHLTECYRQTRRVGRRSVEFLQHISERYTKHIHKANKRDFARRHQLSVETANEMRFVADGGRAHVYENTDLTTVHAELQQLRAQLLWRQWHPLCVVHEHGIRFSSAVKATVDALGGEFIRLDATDEIRGVEYQHVFVVVSRSKLHEIMVTGRSGLSTDDYIAARNLRIPFSRATDSMVVFGLH